MATECKRMGFTEEEMEIRRHQIQQEIRKERYYEGGEWETAETNETMNPHLKRNQPTSSGEQYSDGVVPQMRYLVRQYFRLIVEQKQ